MQLSIQIEELIVPSVLDERVSGTPILAGVLLFGAFISLALARFYNPGIYGTFLLALFKVKGIRTFLKDTIPLSRIGSVFLLINYMLCCLALMLIYMEEPLGTYESLWLVGVPVYIFLWHIVSMALTGWVTGEITAVQEPITFKLIGAELTGVLYFIIGLIWILNGNLEPIMILFTLWIFVIESVVRIIKSFISVTSGGIAWYYFILYLCTLEILPLFVAYQLFYRGEFLTA